MAESETQSHELVEMTVVDQAGRLQIPRELREKKGIGLRAIIEETDEGVLIKPIDDKGEKK